MPTWLDKLRGHSDTPHITAYKEVRAASISWFDKILRHPASKTFDLHRAARKLGLVVEDRTIVFEDENESAVFMDFFLLDYRPDGKSVAESCRFAAGELTPAEDEYHHATLASRTSLFAVAAAHDGEPTIRLRDLLQPDAPELRLTDLGLAGSIGRFADRPLMFTRVVSIRGLDVTGGFSFIFEPRHQSALADGYRRATWSVPAHRLDQRRTGFFLDRNRRLGLPQAFADVVPRPEP